MTRVFIAGSINIKHLDPSFKQRVENVVASDFGVLVGDADGADSSIQELLLQLNAKHIKVYCTGDCPRNNVGSWETVSVKSSAARGTRAFFTAKDVAMAGEADFGLMIWDARSTGTLSNVIELLRQKKKSLVFVNKLKRFFPVGAVSQLHELLDVMSETSRAKAEAKIGLSKKIGSLTSEVRQSDMF